MLSNCFSFMYICEKAKVADQQYVGHRILNTDGKIEGCIPPPPRIAGQSL